MNKSTNKYGAIFGLAFKQAWGCKANLSGTLFFLFILLVLYNRLWNVIGVDTNVQNLSSTYIWYLLFAEMIILSTPKMERILFDDIRSGTFAYYVNKPVSFFAMRYFEGLGNMSVTFIVLGIFGSFTTFILTGEPPFVWYQFPLIVLMCYFSACLTTLFYSGVGLCALWLNSIRTLGMALQRLAFIFGGAIFPLSIYPDWFNEIAKWTPFYSIYYLTIKLVYDFSWANLAIALSLNLFWISLVVSFIVFAYSKLQKRVNVYGG